MKSGVWELLVLPGNAESMTVEELFGDDFPANSYASEWIVFTFDAVTNSYSDPGLQGSIDQGEGFWFAQITGQDVEIDTPSTLASPALTQSTACESSAGCITIPLYPHDSTTTGANLVGIPLATATPLSKVLFITTASGSACSTGCTLSEAVNHNYLFDVMWGYNSAINQYEDLSDKAQLEPWQAFWLGIKPAAYNTGFALMVQDEPLTPPIAQGPSTAHYCSVDQNLVGGVFTDSDGTAPRIDDVGVRGLSHTRPRTQSEFAAWLDNSHLYELDGNLHGFGRNALDALQDPNKAWPEAAHVLLRHLQVNARVSEVIHSDGMSTEGMGYHFIWLGGMEQLSNGLQGYKDPDDWVPPPGVKKITQPLTHVDIIPPTARTKRFVSSAVKATLPDSSYTGSDDSGLEYVDLSVANSSPGWGSGGPHFGHSIDRVAKSYLLPGFGQLGLGEGRLDDTHLQVQSILHFSTKDNGHNHNDSLMFGLFGNGRNLYSFSGHQNQSHAPRNKNMVMINNRDQNKYVSDLAGRLEVFAPLPGVKFARVDASHIIHGGNGNGTGRVESVDRYRRTLVQNTIDIEKAYTLDIFEVDGGEQHDYLMRGSSVLRQNYPRTSINTSSGTMPIADTKEAKFSNTQKANFQANDSFWVDVTFQDDDHRGARTHFPAQGTSGELYLNDMEEQNTFSSGAGDYVPQFTIHRTGAAPLKSTFVAVHEVMDGSGQSFIQSVERQQLDGKSIAVTVSLKNGRVDTYLISFDGKKTMTLGSVSANALMAAHSTFNGKSDLWLVGGDSASDGTRRLNAVNSEVTGSMAAIFREADGAPSDFFDSDIPLPAGYELHGQALLVEHFDDDGDLLFVNSFRINYIENACGKTRVHVDNDPGIRDTNTGIREIFYPRRPKSYWSRFGLGNEVHSSRLRFVNSATTVPHIVKMQPGREDMSERIRANPALPLDHNQAIKINTAPLGAEIAYRVNDSTTDTSSSGVYHLAGDSRIRYTVSNPDGFVEAPEFEEHYYKPLPALNGTLSDPGLWAEKWSGYTYNFDRDDPLNSMWMGRWPEQDKVVKTLSFAEVDYFKHADGSGAWVTGYLNAPSTGLYRFYTRMDGAVKLSIDDKVIVQENGMRQSPEWVGEVYLQAGPHKIEVWQYAKTRAHFSVNMDGPNLPYGEIPENLLFRTLN